jgi:hypothetical protein
MVADGHRTRIIGVRGSERSPLRAPRNSGTRDKTTNLFVSLGYFSKRLSRCCPGRDNTRGWNEIAARSMNIGIDIWMMPTVVIPA